MVREQGKNDLHGQPLRVVQSTPSLKKGSPARKMSLGKEPKISVSKGAEMREVKRASVRHLNLTGKDFQSCFVRKRTTPGAESGRT